MNKKRKGFGGAAFLIQALVYCVLIGIITNSSLNLQSSQFSSLSASRVELEAQQWAEIIANEVKLTGYDTIADQARKPIDGSSATWESDISVGPEKIVGDDPDNKIKIVTVNVYKPGDSVSKFALKVPLSTQGSGSSDTPVGSIIAWPFLEIPDNWLECDGQTVNASKYPKLAALMASVPDYRGVFLRGHGSVISSHFNFTNHRSGNLGDLQGDTIRNITGEIIHGTKEYNNPGLITANGVFKITSGAPRTDGNGKTHPTLGGIIVFDASTVVPTDNENRPINRAVKWIIKAA